MPILACPWPCHWMSEYEGFHVHMLSTDSIKKLYCSGRTLLDDMEYVEQVKTILN